MADVRAIPLPMGRTPLVLAPLRARGWPGAERPRSPPQEIRGLGVDFRSQTWYPTALSQHMRSVLGVIQTALSCGLCETGATGLEPAASGVTNPRPPA